MASEAIGIWSPTTVGRSVRAGITMNGVGSCSARLPPVAFSERAPLVLVSRVSDSSGCVGAVKGKPWNVTPSSGSPGASLLLHRGLRPRVHSTKCAWPCSIRHTVSSMAAGWSVQS